jgi:hypothetical protein
MTDKAISPLRQRLIEDMAIRRLGPKTQHDYIRAAPHEVNGGRPKTLKESSRRSHRPTSETLHGRGHFQSRNFTIWNASCVRCHYDQMRANMWAEIVMFCENTASNGLSVLAAKV